MVGAAFVTILMVVGNTMAMSMRERTREIGVLKTLGFPSGRILKLVLGESVLLALLGGPHGHGRGHPGDPGAARVDRQFRARPAVTPDIYLAALALMLLLGIATESSRRSTPCA